MFKPWAGEMMKQDLVESPTRACRRFGVRSPRVNSPTSPRSRPSSNWLANLTNPKTRRAYKIDVEEFIDFAGLGGIAELRSITRAHVTPGGCLRGCWEKSRRCPCQRDRRLVERDFDDEREVS
jgi:hypothetical protein